jgi:hypothetical protein
MMGKIYLPFSVAPCMRVYLASLPQPSGLTRATQLSTSRKMGLLWVNYKRTSKILKPLGSVYEKGLFKT